MQCLLGRLDVAQHKQHPQLHAPLELFQPCVDVVFVQVVVPKRQENRSSALADNKVCAGYGGRHLVRNIANVLEDGVVFLAAVYGRRGAVREEGRKGGGLGREENVQDFFVKKKG